MTAEVRRSVFDPAARYERDISSAEASCLCRRSSSSSSQSSEKCSAEDAFFQRCDPGANGGYVFPGLFNFAPIVAKTDGPSALLAPGAASMPHRFFSPGLYLWHDSNHPSIHGVVLVRPSDTVVDACGVCGGDSTSCTDCLGTPLGTAQVDSCGVCSDPRAPGWAPNPAVDCTGTCNGTAVIDDCDQCSGGTTGRVHNEAMDCSGACYGHSVPDCTGVCNGGAQFDCLGLCNGPAVLMDGMCLLPSKKSHQVRFSPQIVEF